MDDALREVYESLKFLSKNLADTVEKLEGVESDASKREGELLQEINNLEAELEEHVALYGATEAGELMNKAAARLLKELEGRQLEGQSAEEIADWLHRGLGILTYPGALDLALDAVESLR